MKNIYFDNAATTQMLPEVIEVMSESMLLNYGNPSSVHQVGRKAKVAVEKARKNIANHFNVSAKELVFTSGGTEANNLVLKNAVTNLGVKRIITTKIEHHAVLDVVEYLGSSFDVEVNYLNLNDLGEIDLKELEAKLSNNEVKTLVSLMFVNNEIGNILPVKEVSYLCNKYEAIFHSDAVQAIGHFNIDLKEVPIDFLVASAHKFHGPKGVGFLCYNNKYIIKPMLMGGGQERGVRSSTENVHAIIGMEKALDVSLGGLKEDNKHISIIKKYLINKLVESFKGVLFNGLSSQENKSTGTIVNVRFPLKDERLLFKLDLFGICASAGSACQSGGNKKSHVLKEILKEDDVNFTSIRFSFSKFSTTAEVDFFLQEILKITKPLNESF